MGGGGGVGWVEVVGERGERVGERGEMVGERVERVGERREGERDGGGVRGCLSPRDSLVARFESRGISPALPMDAEPHLHRAPRDAQVVALAERARAQRDAHGAHRRRSRASLGGHLLEAEPGLGGGARNLVHKKGAGDTAAAGDPTWRENRGPLRDEACAGSMGTDWSVTDKWQKRGESRVTKSRQKLGRDTEKGMGWGWGWGGGKQRGPICECANWAKRGVVSKVVTSVTVILDGGGK